MNNYIKPRTRRTVQRSDIALEMSSRRRHTLPVSILTTGGKLDYPTGLKPPTPPQLHVSETNIRHISCRNNERQLIHVTVVRRVRPRAERSSAG